MDEEKSLREALEKSAEKLGAAEPPAHDFLFFKGLVDKHQASARRAQRLQLALFAVVAVLLVSAVVVCTGSFPVFILALQAAAVAGAIAALAAALVRNKRLRAEAG